MSPMNDDSLGSGQVCRTESGDWEEKKSLGTCEGLKANGSSWESIKSGNMSPTKHETIMTHANVWVPETNMDG